MAFLDFLTNMLGGQSGQDQSAQPQGGFMSRVLQAPKHTASFLSNILSEPGPTVEQVRQAQAGGKAGRSDEELPMVLGPGAKLRLGQRQGFISSTRTPQPNRPIKQPRRPMVSSASRRRRPSSQARCSG